MKPAKFEYERPKDLPTALHLLSQNPGIKVMAGGQSLGPMLNLRIVTPEALLDISRLEELRHITIEGDEIVIGAGIRHAEFEDGRVPSPIEGLFPRVAIGIAYRAVRNRGTVGGSLAHADPAADWPAVMIALGARVTLVSVRGSRTIQVEKLAVSPLETCLERDEIITLIRVPRYGKGARAGRYKVNKQPGEFAETSAIIVHDPNTDVTRSVSSGSNLLPLLLQRTSETISDLKRGKASMLDAAITADLASQGYSSYETSLHRTSVSRAAREVLGT